MIRPPAGRGPRRHPQPGARARVRPGVAALASLALLVACAPEPLPPPEPDPIRVDETLGVVRIAPDGRIAVRLVLDLSGDPERARTVVAAARAALEDFGAIQGFAVDLGVPLDAACDGPGGATAAATVVAESTVLAVIGPTCDASLATAAPVLTEAGLVVVTPGVVAPAFTQVPLGERGPLQVDGLLRTAPNLLWEAAGAARFAYEELGHDRAATVSDGSEDGDALAEEFAAAFEALGGTVIVAATLPDDPEDDLLATLEVIAAGGIAVGWLGVGPDRIAALSGAWASGARLGRTVRIAPSTAVSPETLADARLEGLHVTLPLLAVDDATSSVTGMAAGPVRERISGLLEDGEVSRWWATAYDATVLLLRAIDDVSLVDGDRSLVVSRADLRLALEGATMAGLSGRIRCDAFGDCGSPAVEVRLRGVEAATDPTALPLVRLLLP
jgi:ABC-type branched-subunit amino acid transport system substrate-binding protein